MKTILSIAGSDPTCGAGTQSDIRTIQTLGAHPLSVITSITVQNTLGVSRFVPVDIQLFRDQLTHLFNDIVPDAVKIGMIGDTRFFSVMIELFHRFNIKNIIWDPVMRSSSGDNLIEDLSPLDLQDFMSYVDVVTPNIPEFNSLFGVHETSQSILESIEKFRAKYLVLKGGHGEHEKEIEDILFDVESKRVYHQRHARIDTQNDHGTGCMYSAAMATLLGQGHTVRDAFSKSSMFMSRSLAFSVHHSVGKGRGIVYPTTELPWLSLS